MAPKTIQFTVNSEKELGTVAKEIIYSNHSKIIILSGDLGTGKTALVKSFCKEIESMDQVTSPTFSIINEYVYDEGIIYHFDLYRLESLAEVLDIGIEEYLDSGHYCLIEWPDLIKDIIYRKYIDVNIATMDGNARNILISFV